MKNICFLSRKISLFTAFFFVFAIFFAQQQKVILEKAPKKITNVLPSLQSVQLQKGNFFELNAPTHNQSFVLNSKCGGIPDLPRNTGRISQVENTSEIDQVSKNDESPFTAMKGKQEEVSKRDAFSKSFKNADGSFTAIIGAAPIHYKNKKGQFVDIDHAIQKTTDASYSYANTANLFESYFGATSNEGIKNSTAEGEIKEFLNTKMYWEVDGKEVGVVQSSNSKIKVKDDKAYYTNLYGNISAEFTIEAGRRKLNYIIPDKTSLGKIPANVGYLVFSEDVILPDGWTHKITNSGVLILDQNIREIYLYENPSSSDALNKLDKDKNTLFETVLNGVFLTIKIKVKTSWLLETKRQFPVLVDPTVNVTTNNAVNWTGHVWSDGEYIDSTINTGRVSGYLIQGALRFNLSAIPIGSTVTAATGYIYILAGYGTGVATRTWALRNSSDPLTVPSGYSAQGLALYNSMTTAHSVTTGVTSLGWRTSNFSASGTTYLQNAIANGYVPMGLYAMGTWTNGQYFETAGRTSGNRPYIVINYTVPIACAGTPIGGTAVLNSNTGTFGSTFNASVTGSTTGVSGLTYQWQNGPSAAGPWTDIAGATAATVNLTASNVIADLYVRRKITCSGNNSYSSAVSYRITCTPSHTSGNCAAPGDCGYIGISNVKIGTINNTTSYNNPPPAYNNYSYLSTDISQGTTYPLSITYRDSSTNLGKVAAWIDWNNDGDFDDANEFIGVANNLANNTIINANVTVPVGTTVGAKRLRVRSTFNGEMLTAVDACTIKQYGETEDYSLNVIIPVYCEPISWDPEGLYINSVAFVGTLKDPNPNISTFGSTGFENYTGLAIKAEQAQGEGINIIARSTGNVFGRGTWKAWVDWNKNEIYEPATEEVYNIQGFAGPEVTFGFVIPPTTAAGDYRIRIRVNNGLDYWDFSETFGFDFSPCDNFEIYAPYDPWIEDYGETEDYLFTVVAKCNSVITSVTNGKNCGPGTVNLQATASAGVTQFRWYTTKTGGTLLGTSAPTGTSTTFTTPSISATTKYYVTAYNGCESQVRTLVTAIINPTPVVSFTQSIPDVCGDNSVLQLTAGGDKEVVYLINENFESGSTLGIFKNENDPAVDTNSPTVKANTSWKKQTSTFVPGANAWFPAISSGFGANKFALAYSDSKTPDYPTSTIENSIALTTAVNTNTYLNLTLTLKLYYSRYIPDGITGQDEYVNIELSTDGGSSYPILIESFTSDVEIGTRFRELTYDLSAYINQPNLKIRVRHHSAVDVNGWLPDGVAIDDIMLYGEKPLSTAFSYDTSIVNAYTNVSCTPMYAYVPGTSATTIWLKPTPTQLENSATFTVPVSATLSNGCSATGSVDIINNSKIWNNVSSAIDWAIATDWRPSLNASVPTADKCVIIKTPVTLNSTTDAFAKNLTVQAGGNLQIAGNLTVTDFVRNLGATDDLTVKSDGNLIQISPLVPNSGNINSERYVSDMNNVLATQMDYVYWSSPVTGQQTKGLGGFSPGTPSNRFFRYNEPNDNFYETGDPTFVPGKGYAVQAETSQGYAPNATGYSKTYNFRGTPHNGDIAININRSPDAGLVLHGFNLVGNPYPSNIDFDKLYTANAAKIYNVAYFWTNNNYEMSQQGSGYGGNNYAVYNGVGGNSATHAASGTGVTAVPNGIIKVGQGFIIQKSVVGGPVALDFKNSYGSGQDLRVTTSSTFFQKDGAEKNRFWINLTSPVGLINTQLIGYIPGATEGYDPDYDAEIFGMSSDVFYSKAGDKNVLIQGKGDFVVSDKVLLGANIFKNGNYTINLDQAEGVFASGQNIYLKDLLSGIVTNLSEGSYTFAATAGLSEGRFEIIYEPQVFLSTDGTAKEELVIYRDGNDFVVKAQSKKITYVEVYDTGGRLIYTMKTNATQVVIPAEQLPSSVYIVKITQTEAVTSRKILK